MQRFDEEDLAYQVEEIEFNARNAFAPEFGIPAVGRFYEGMTASRRALGILRLLLQADGQGFVGELVQSARARIHFLARCKKAGFLDFNACASRSEPLFDALAAGAFDLARDIGALSPQAFRPNEEYEDDFCYARFFHDHAQGVATDLASFERFEEALEGASSARLDVCRALARRDQAAFDAAFGALLETRASEVDEERAGFAQEDAARAVGTYIFVEGLGVLRVAERLGLVTPREVPQCPRLARVQVKWPLPGDVLPAL